MTYRKELAKIKKKMDDVSCFSKVELEHFDMFAKMLAINVRNQMENFHVEHLTDEQMKELNPIIRNAIYSQLITITKANMGDKIAKETISFSKQAIPHYWEKCKKI